MILLMGEKNDAQIQSVAAQLEKLQQPYAVFDSSAFPQADTIGYQPQSGEMVLQVAGQKLALTDVKSMYWRNYMAPKNGSSNLVASKDSTSLLKSVLNELGDKAKNSAAAVRFHQEKPRQLATVAKLGVQIPATYVGNDPVAVREFCEKNQQVIFKPVTGGDFAQLITAEHLSDEHLERSLRQSPVTLQRFIKGTNIRSYVIGDEVFSAEILSEHTDFRTDSGIKLEVVELPEPIKQQALAIKAALGLAWTGIDWRRDEQGNYFFLEANPSPMFVNFEQYTGLPVAQRLAQLLAA
jgi:glutathione synthase/RimK-type ligase-like ATP-grasp enzyme